MVLSNVGKTTPKPSIDVHVQKRELTFIISSGLPSNIPSKGFGFFREDTCLVPIGSAFVPDAIRSLAEEIATVPGVDGKLPIWIYKTMVSVLLVEGADSRKAKESISDLIIKAAQTPLVIKERSRKRKLSYA